MHGSSNLNLPTFYLEPFMATQISSRLAALAIAVLMNSLIIGAVAYLFSGQILRHSGAVARVNATEIAAQQAQPQRLAA